MSAPSSDPAAPAAASAAALPAPGAQSRAERAFRRFSRLVLRHGLRRSIVALTGLVTLAAVAMSELVISLIGHGDRVVAAISSSTCSLVLTPLVGSLVLRLVFELEDARQRLGELATRDDLTGVANRRHFMAQVAREWELARRHQSGGTLMLIDVDSFKQVNDTHGHLCGDELLRRIATAIGGSLRNPDVLARFGGEEFIVFLPHTDAFGALDVAERIRARVAQTEIDWRGTPVSVTVSIGIAPVRAELPSIDWMIHEADTALYAAKAAGRNCVRTLEFSRDPNGSSEMRSFKT